MFWKYILLIIGAYNVANSTDISIASLNLVDNQISTELGFHHLTIFLSCYPNNMQSVLKNAVERIPSTIISMETLQFENVSRVFNLPIYTSPRHKTVFVFFHYGVLDDSFNYYIDYLAKISTKQERSHCLIIYYQTEISNDTNDNIRKLLNYAWSKLFLDFTIMKYNELNALINYFNPFSKKYEKQVFTETTEIFPNKLTNGYKTGIRMVAFHDHPFSIIKYDDNDKIIMEGTHIPLIYTVAETMNFKLDFVHLFPRGTKLKVLMNTSLTMLAQGDINLYTEPLSMKAGEDFLQVMIGHGCESLVALVPIMPVVSLQVPLTVFLKLVVIPVLIILYVYAAKALKIYSAKWRVLDVYQVLMGLPVQKKVHKFIDRIIFMSVILLSINYSINFYTEFMKVKLVLGEVPFDTFDEMWKYKLKVYCNRVAYARIYNTTLVDPMLRNLESRTYLVNDISECIELLAAGHQDVACVLATWKAEMYALKHRKDDGSPIMKRAKPSFTCDDLAYMFERGSYLAGRFERIFCKIHESGIWRPMNMLKVYAIKNFGKKVLMSQSSGEQKEFISDHILVVLVFGYFISILSFLIEKIFSKSAL